MVLIVWLIFKKMYKVKKWIMSIESTKLNQVKKLNEIYKIKSSQVNKMKSIKSCAYKKTVKQ